MSSKDQTKDPSSSESRSQQSLSSSLGISSSNQPKLGYSEASLHPETKPSFSFFGRMRHPIKFMKFKILDFTAPDIP